MKVHLPISKSIANRILLLQAIHGDPLMRVSSDMPDDVLVLHDALQKIRDIYGVPGSFPLGRDGVGLTLNLKNCGTALRFLEVHIAQCYPGEPIVLDGDPRLMERKGAPTSQTTSALIMHGIDVPVQENESPYITMTRKVMEMYKKISFPSGRDGVGSLIEACWSSASYWYEYIAIHGGELLLEGLKEDSIQGDRVVADIYAEHFGVTTTFTPQGAKVSRKSKVESKKPISIDFTNCPDLFPAIALTCEKLGMQLEATGTERLKYKESDRIEAVRLHEVRNDHRMAMALMAGGAYPLPKGKGEEMQRIVAKSYPTFMSQFNSLLLGRAGVGCCHITPIKGVNDDNKGKKYALSKLIHAAEAEYVWMHDDDVELPKAAKEPNLTFPEGKENLDLIILPLRMESALPSGRDGVGSSLLERLQIAEYAAIQELTMRSAKRDQAVMCSGANLIVKREVWLECEKDLHFEIPSGDDMFLLEAVKRRGYKVGVIDEAEFTAVVRPQTSWKAFWHQRMRWAGKAPKYTDKDILRCGRRVVLANVLQLIFFPIILIKFPIEYNLIRQREITNYKSPITNILTILLLEIVYPIYLLICLIGGMGRKKEW